jgi:hypothetical protein
MSRRRALMLSGDNYEPGLVFHAPLTANAFDVVGGLAGTVVIETPSEGGSVSFTSEGCLFTGSPVVGGDTGGGIFFENLPVDVRDWSNSWTISYYAKNVTGYSFGHQLTVQFGRHVSGKAFLVYSPSYASGSANNICVGAYMPGGSTYINSANPSDFNQYTFNHEKIVWDATTSTFYLYVNNIFRSSYTITKSFYLPTLDMKALSIGCGLNKGNGVIYCVNNYFMGVIRDVKIYDRVV